MKRASGVLLPVFSLPSKYGIGCFSKEAYKFIDQLKEDVGEVIFVGIQPDIVGFYYPMTQPVKDAVATLYARLDGWQGQGGFAALEAAEEQAFPGLR